MVTQIKTRDLNNNIYATINKLPDVMEKRNSFFKFATFCLWSYICS